MVVLSGGLEAKVVKRDFCCVYIQGGVRVRVGVGRRVRVRVKVFYLHPHPQTRATKIFAKTLLSGSAANAPFLRIRVTRRVSTSA